MKSDEGPRAQNWATPQVLFRELELRFGRGKFTLDACAEAWNAKCSNYFDEDANGLAQTWTGNVFVNPPYNNIAPWARKAVKSVKLDKTADVVVLLVPVRTEQRWFHEWALPYGRVSFIQGRVSFLPPDHVKPSSNREGSMVVVFDRDIEAKCFK